MNIELITNEFEGTCSMNNLKPNHITFIRKSEYLNKFKKINNMKLGIIIPHSVKNMSTLLNMMSNNIKFFYSKNVDYDFTLIHNAFCELGYATNEIISDKTKIHGTVIYDVQGIKVATAEDGKKIQFVHTGGIEIEENVEIGPYSIIHIATMDMTIIRNGVKIGAHCNIGHNNDIGENSVIAAGVLTSGSIKIGKNCWLGTGCIIRNGITICDDVLIGTGSVVIKDITKPGVYVGNPAKFLRQLDGNKGWDS